MFKQALARCVESTEGAVAALVMGFDGIPIDSFVAAQSGYDVEPVGQEFSVVLKEISRAGEMLNAGATQEVSIRSEKLLTVVRMINDEYFAAVVLKPDGNGGKARFLLRLEAGQFAKELTM